MNQVWGRTAGDVVKRWRVMRESLDYTGLWKPMNNEGAIRRFEERSDIIVKGHSVGHVEERMLEQGRRRKGR